MNTLLSILFLFSFLQDYDPKKGDWICWYKSIGQEELCGTFGYSKNKKIAQEKGLGLCESYCTSKCELEYCDKL